MTKSLPLALVAVLISAFASPAYAGALLEVNGHLLKWVSHVQHGATVITYAVLSRPYTLPNGKRILSPDNCSSMHAFGDIVASSPGIAAEAAESELRAAFAAWEAAANISFAEVSDPSQANIVVGAQDFPVGRAFTNLSYLSGHGILPVEKALGGPGPSAEPGDTEASGAVSGIEQSYVCLNPRMRWKTGFDGDLDIYDLRHTFTHEIGHAIGLDHPGSSGAIMAYRYDEHVRELQPSDIAAVQELYGPPAAQK
ncbi:MAG: matrixin family metalloprotease [Rhodomicrobium sp.]